MTLLISLLLIVGVVGCSGAEPLDKNKSPKPSASPDKQTQVDSPGDDVSQVAEPEEAWATPLNFALFIADQSPSPQGKLKLLTQVGTQLANSGRSEDAMRVLKLAEESLPTIENESQKQFAMGALAIGFSKAGVHDESLRLLREVVSKPNFRGSSRSDGVLGAIALLIGEGRTQQVGDALSVMSDPGRKVSLLSYACRKMPSDATTEERLAVADLIDDAASKSRLMRTISGQLASSGDYAAAIDLIEQMGTGREKKSALEDVSRMQSDKGDIDGAHATLEMIEDQTARDAAFASLASNLAQKASPEWAVATAQLIKSDQTRRNSLKNVALGLVWRGDRDAATVETAVGTVQLAGEGYINSALEHLTYELANSGNVERAAELATQLSSKPILERALAKVAIQAAKRGQIETAEELSSQLDDKTRKAAISLAIARYLLRTGQTEKANPLITSAVNEIAALDEVVGEFANNRNSSELIPTFHNHVSLLPDAAKALSRANRSDEARKLIAKVMDSTLKKLVESELANTFSPSSADSLESQFSGMFSAAYAAIGDEEQALKPLRQGEGRQFERRLRIIAVAAAAGGHDDVAESVSGQIKNPYEKEAAVVEGMLELLLHGDVSKARTLSLILPQDSTRQMSVFAGLASSMITHSQVERVKDVASFVEGQDKTLEAMARTVVTTGDTDLLKPVVGFCSTPAMGREITLNVISSGCAQLITEKRYASAEQLIQTLHDVLGDGPSPRQFEYRMGNPLMMMAGNGKLVEAMQIVRSLPRGQGRVNLIRNVLNRFCRSTHFRNADQITDACKPLEDVQDQATVLAFGGYQLARIGDSDGGGAMIAEGLELIDDTFDAPTRHHICEFAWFGLNHCVPSNQTSLIADRIGRLVRVDLNSPAQASLDQTAKFAATSVTPRRSLDESLFNDVLDALERMNEANEFRDRSGPTSHADAKRAYALRAYTTISPFLWLKFDGTALEGQPTDITALIKTEFSKEEMTIARRIVKSLSP
jgi:hypothetical protein